MRQHVKKAVKAATPLSLTRLNQTLSKVRREMVDLGFWCDKLASCQVWLRTFPEKGMSDAYGYQWFGDREDGRLVGDIVLPSVSPAMWGNYLRWLRGEEGTVILLDVLRHEYGHAFADANPRRMNSPKFARAFGHAHESWGESWTMEYDPEHHITEYAATDPMEDFAENFYLYLKHRGTLPAAYRTGPILERWKFIRGLRRH